MNILYYFYELNTPMYRWQYLHFIDELKRAGHVVRCFNPLDYCSIDEANEKVIEIAKSVKSWDLFITCDEQSIIYRDTVVEISKLGIPTCLICWDNLELPYKQKKIAPIFDLVWITSVETKYLFEKWGCKKILFLPYAANPYTFTPSWGKAINAVGFIGSPYGSRVNKLNVLLQAGIQCDVYSDALFQKGYNNSLGSIQHYKIKDTSIKAFRYLHFPIGRKVLLSTILNKFYSQHSLLADSQFFMAHKSVPIQEMNNLYSNFSISLNITELRDTYILRHPVHKLHLRTFEIPMSGGLQIASRTTELSSYFEEDKEIVMYGSREEMISKAKFYLDSSNENTVLSMKKAARTRCEHEHTWMHRFNIVFNELGLN